ncbi:glycerol dehydrogenase [Aureimonas frigidaquae]|uniref:Glycerol dehydrogenase n=1 Tax=Aureimonas frigidaquae TaxID=424757 RepID=A0A0P0Z4A9_9HYPH|nr:glycerol dehydrogenase [Aureimonas frigidaquae]BAT28836.1 iron-containing alcohol dehydrogenase [Aureimonas frigidaquae]
MYITGARFPGRYVQAPGLISRLGAQAETLGKHALVILDRNLADVLRGPLEEGVKPLSAVISVHGGECSEQEITRNVEEGRAKGVDMIIGVGGGKALDTAKSVAFRLGGLPCVIVPTIAASDAPCSALAVVYKESDHSVDYDYFLPRNPDLVLVDTQIIAQAPSRFLAAGIGDALATWYEAESSRIADAPNCWGTHGSALAFEIARFCRDTIVEYGAEALRECDAGEAGPAFERVVEANILLSGAGFESGGVAGAHAIHHGLCELPDVHHHLHGEKVAIGVLATLLIHGNRDEYEKVRDYCLSVRLPTRLSDIGIVEVSDEKLQAVAQRACRPGEIMENEPITVTPDMVVAALRQLA